MRRLGLSIYPEKSSMDEIKKYLLKASKLGFKRIFSCLLSVTKDIDEIKKEFIATNEYAHELGYEIIVDVSPAVFEKFGISYNNLSFFKDIKADGIRLDQGFSGFEESMMTYNPQNLKIEINMSNNAHTIDTIMDYMPNKYNLLGCHNFYPHENTGISLELFQACTDRFKRHNIRTAAFISSNVKNAFGPWDTLEGLPTLEMHRNLPMDVQLKHLIAMDNIDDILISNCYPSDEELESLKDLSLNYVTFDATLVENLPEIERKIILEELHLNRGDVGEYYLRSSNSRVKYKDNNFELFNPVEDIKRGDIIMDSSKYGRYAGELQIVLKDFKNNGKINVVGKIRKEEIFILDFIKPWQKFMIRETK